MIKTISTVIILTIALLLAYKLGQAQQFNKTQHDIFEAFERSSDTYYIIVSDNQYNGEWAMGRCLEPEAESILAKYIINYK